MAFSQGISWLEFVLSLKMVSFQINDNHRSRGREADAIHYIFLIHYGFFFVFVCFFNFKDYQILLFRSRSPILLRNGFPWFCSLRPRKLCCSLARKFLFLSVTGEKRLRDYDRVCMQIRAISRSCSFTKVFTKIWKVQTSIFWLQTIKMNYFVFRETITYSSS